MKGTTAGKSPPVNDIYQLNRKSNAGKVDRKKSNVAGSIPDVEIKKSFGEVIQSVGKNGVENNMGNPQVISHNLGGQKKTNTALSSDGKNLNKSDHEVGKKPLVIDTSKPNQAKKKSTTQRASVVTVADKKGRRGYKGTSDTKVQKSPSKKAFARFFTKYISMEEIVIKDPRVREAVDKLELSQSHLRKIREKFMDIDIDGSGDIDISEFLEMIKEQKSPLTIQLFKKMDLDDNGAIDYEEYVYILCNYCMFTKDEILRFCFECFDLDNSGSISEYEFRDLCKYVNNSNPTFPGNFKKALELFDTNQDGMIDYREFCEMERKFPMIFYPAFRLQDTMQKNTLGETEWNYVLQNYAHNQAVEEYRDTHGGRSPPLSCIESLYGVFCCCFVKRKKVSRSLLKEGMSDHQHHAIEQRVTNVQKKAGR